VWFGSWTRILDLGAYKSGKYEIQIKPVETLYVTRFGRGYYDGRSVDRNSNLEISGPGVSGVSVSDKATKKEKKTHGQFGRSGSKNTITENNALKKGEVYTVTFTLGEARPGLCFELAFQKTNDVPVCIYGPLGRWHLIHVHS